MDQTNILRDYSDQHLCSSFDLPLSKKEPLKTITAKEEMKEIRKFTNQGYAFWGSLDWNNFVKKSF